jgi:hypothetical protein
MPDNKNVLKHVHPPNPTCFQQVSFTSRRIHSAAIWWLSFGRSRHKLRPTPARTPGKVKQKLPEGLGILRATRVRRSA